MPVLEAAKVVDHGHDPAARGAPVLLAAQPATNHLHVADGAEDLPSDEHHVRSGCVEPGGQHTVVALTVRRCSHNEFGGDIAAEARPVLNYELLVEALRQPLAREARDDVGRTGYLRHGSSGREA